MSDCENVNAESGERLGWATQQSIPLSRTRPDPEFITPISYIDLLI